MIVVLTRDTMKGRMMRRLARAAFLTPALTKKARATAVRLTS